MLITTLYSKIHQATVTKCEISYNGSMGIDQDYMRQAGLHEGQHQRPKIEASHLDGMRVHTLIR